MHVQPVAALDGERDKSSRLRARAVKDEFGGAAVSAAEVDFASQVAFGEGIAWAAGGEGADAGLGLGGSESPEGEC